MTFDMASNKMEVHHQWAEPWKVTLVDTGALTQTGGRLKRVAPYLADEEAFCFTYGDGVADVFVSGARGQAGVLYLGDAAGNFAPAATQPWASQAAADDVGAVFFDANADGHLDLFISAGGVEGSSGADHFRNRLYLGDGQVLRYQPDEADLLATERKLAALWQAILRAYERDDWPARTSKLCDYCSFKALCPAWGGTPPDTAGTRADTVEP